MRRHNAQCKSYGPHERRCTYPAGHYGSHRDCFGDEWQDIPRAPTEAELIAVELQCMRMGLAPQ